ncbi:MAG TPA: heparan-alpha-glucosaminide N-acetyltransferase domain-containing protein [Puia sp.]|nr:heparan-alpha-glucosaminide N-acetyltransferase domain-containing protein [Puia sp.]
MIKRIISVDIVRGLVMVIMALDHCRDLLGASSITERATNLQTTTPGLFFTRWITHLCAPTFVFLSGVSAFLSIKGNRDVNAARRFLITRGIWLIVVNFTINNFAVFFDIHFSVLFSQVIAAIGFGFIGLAILLPLKAKTIGLTGLFIIFSHDLLAGVSFAKDSIWEIVWTIFMSAGFFQISSHFLLSAVYPYIPWLGVMLAGYSAGTIFHLPESRRRRTLLLIGVGALTLFVIVRFLNFYGDPNPWARQKTFLFTILSFINTTKYPPSLLFTLMTLGISMIILSFAENWENRLSGILVVYGRVPFFYWMVHWFVIHFIAIGFFLWQGYHWNDLQFSGFGFGHPKNGTGGVGLGVLYLFWVLVVLLMYPISKAYGDYKSVHREKKWLRYL